MQVNQNTKPKPQFPSIHTDLLDRMVQQADNMTTKPAPKPTPVIKRWPRLLVW